MIGKGSRWRPRQVAKLVQLVDDAAFPVSFTIAGNHEDPAGGNPIPYTRMTQRSAHVSRSAIRYRHWKRYVVECYCAQVRKSPPQVANGHYRLDCKVYFLAPLVGRQCGHADPENVRKGIQDALFAMGDQHVIGTVEMKHIDEKPRVEVVIYKGW
jgi:Holliday junction resolvase RusA-like endonuclease